MIFERLSSVIERKATDVSALTWTELFPQMSSRSGVSVNVDSALRTTAVFACARVLAEGIAQLPKNIFDIDPAANTKKKNTQHPAFKLLSRAPNEFMTSFEFYETMMLHAVLTGNAYAYLGWSGNKIKEIVPLVPGNVQVMRHADWTLTYNVSDLEGKIATLPAENILHLRGPSWNAYSGLEAIQLAREAIGLAIATEETHASLHANGAQPGGVLAVKGKLDKEARERLKSAWQAFQGGVANRFKTAVLDVDAEWKPLSMTGVDSQHLETRRFQIEEICRAMNVYPQMVMSADKTSTFASAEQFFLAFVTYNLMPWIVRWEQAINRTILGDDDTLICKFNVASLMRGDSAQRSTFYQQALGGARPEAAWMTKNEVRELEDLNPIDGGDEIPKPPEPVQPQPGADPVAKALELVALALKMNPNHDDAGRFAPGDGSGYPLAPKSDWYSHADYQAAGGVMQSMHPKAFLAQARPLTIDEVSRENIDILKEHIRSGKTLDPLALYPGGAEDGRHRANAALELGITSVPVINFRPGAKMNPNHDELGRFATGDGGGGPRPGVHGKGDAARQVKRDWIANSPLKTIDEIYKGVPANKRRWILSGLRSRKKPIRNTMMVRSKRLTA
jgi:HK97 family phage portal protein